MYCGHCGANIPEGAKFCPGCGAAAPQAQTPAAKQPVDPPAPERAGRGRRAGLIAGICAAAVVLLALVCVFANMAQKKTAASSSIARSSWDDDEWEIRRRDDADDGWKIERSGEAEQPRTSASDSEAVPNPQDYLGEADFIFVDSIYNFLFLFDADDGQTLEQVASFSSSLQEDYGLQLLDIRQNALEDGESQTEYYLAADDSLRDLSESSDDESLVGCHAFINVISSDDRLILAIWYSRDLTVENFDLSAYAQDDTPQSEDTSGQTAGSEQTAGSAQSVDPDSATLPDLGIFLQCGRGEDMSAYGGHLVSYSFDMDEGESIIDDVLDLMLEPAYQLEFDRREEQDTISSSGTLFEDYYYVYTGDATIDKIDILGQVCQLRLSVAHYYSQGRIGMTLYYSSDFTLVDPGKQLKYPPTDFSGNPVSGVSGSSGSTGSNIPEFARPDCSICHGTGDCQVCGGDGYLWSSASDKEDRNCYACHNADGKCTYCNGTGKR